MPTDDFGLSAGEFRRELDHELLGASLANTWRNRQRVGIVSGYRPDNLAGSHRSEQCQGNLGANSAGAEKHPEQLSVRRGAETVETDVVLADVSMGVHHDLLTDARKCHQIAGGHRHLIADAGDIDDDPRV